MTPISCTYSDDPKNQPYTPLHWGFIEGDSDVLYEVQRDIDNVIENTPT